MTHPVLKTWHADHVGFSRLLDVLDRQLVVFQAEGEPDYLLMLDVLRYLREVPDRVHHRLEDEAFRRLARRDPSLELPIRRLLQEHRVIAVAGEELAARLNDVVDGGIAPRERIEAALAHYLVYYRHHLGMEERTILPRAAALLSADDWQAVTDAMAPAAADPVFGEGIDARYRNLRELMAAPALRGDAAAR